MSKMEGSSRISLTAFGSVCHFCKGEYHCLCRKIPEKYRQLMSSVSFLTYFAALAASAAPMGENASLITPPTTRTTTTPLATGSHSVLLMGTGTSYQQGEETTIMGESWSERPDTATLTKGFSIPTYLPPFPDFIPADLPHLQRNAPASPSPADASPKQTNEQQFQTQSPSQSQPRLHAYDSEQKELQLRREKELAKERELLPRRLLSLPPLNATVQAGQHAYLPCKVSEVLGMGTGQCRTIQLCDVIEAF